MIVAIDGCGGAGKTTLASALQTVTPQSVVIRTDDIAWHHSLFDWADLLRTHILEPAIRCEPVAFHPDAWAVRGREGKIAVPVGASVVWLEGTGASRRELTDVLDASVWLQADRMLSAQTCIDREGNTAEAIERSRVWQSAEAAFFADDHPWERSRLVVAGTGVRPNARAGVNLVAAGPRFGSVASDA